MHYLGIDVGSTTVKTVILDEEFHCVYNKYRRHFSKTKETALEELNEALALLGDIPVKAYFTGSAGMGLSERSGVPFVQEVQSAYEGIQVCYPQTDCCIELGGEDAKIIFVTGGLEQRMNASCAGATGAFIDQMATLLNVSVFELDDLASKAQQSYPIASRCGVFAKSDIQALLNQGATKEDIALSIFYAVADQTIAGLAQGRDIEGNILFLGGPLSFMRQLRMAFATRLHLKEEQQIAPEDASIFVAKGAAIFAKKSAEPASLTQLIEKISSIKIGGDIFTGEALFKDESDYNDFLKRHQDFDVVYATLEDYSGKAYLGVDAGSTTTKVVLIGENGQILFSSYSSNKGLPMENVIAQLKLIYRYKRSDCHIVSSAVTGYGEELLKNALGISYGIVETVAHFKAAKYYCPDVHFVLDIGGQDIKCFKIRNGAIDSIMLNEACSSGCGSFLQTFAESLGYGIEEFSKLGYYANHPVELGSRCTVFMNSSVKQAQREGASIGDISAGLSKSVVKNALYKVIRVRNAAELGEKIVVQGGTFLNNAVLRSFEMEIGREVIRPSIAGLMGAFGAALYAKEQPESETLIGEEEAGAFSYDQTHMICKGCTAHCSLAILKFSNGKRFISGNKCDKPEGKKTGSDALDIEAYKRKRLLERAECKGSRGKVGLPLALIMHEQLPLWDTFFKELGFDTVVSPYSSRQLYLDGQHTIPSDTACYPAKLFHGHVDYLLKQDVDFIFYPSQSYNINEHRGTNHFNCPVVAYYGELLRHNEKRLNATNFMDPFLELEDLPSACKSLEKALSRYQLGKAEIKSALIKGMEALRKYRGDVLSKGSQIIEKAREEGKTIVVLAGRPYHNDPEVNHGIDKLLDGMGVAVLSEDALSFGKKLTKTQVLNQWTYHARLYDAATIISENDDMELVQLVSFGCGVDAITADETRRILEEKGKLYTQIKIDEINNLGAVKIRLRSLLAAVEERRKK